MVHLIPDGHLDGMRDLGWLSYRPFQPVWESNDSYVSHDGPFVRWERRLVWESWKAMFLITAGRYYRWANEEVDLIHDSPYLLCNPVILSANLQCQSGKSDKYLHKTSIYLPDSHKLDKYTYTHFSANICLIRPICTANQWSICMICSIHLICSRGWFDLFYRMIGFARFASICSIHSANFPDSPIVSRYERYRCSNSRV